MTESSTPQITLVVLVNAAQVGRLPALMQALASQNQAGLLQIIWLPDDAARGMPAVREQLGLDCCNSTVAASLTDAVARSIAPWLVLRHAAMDLLPGYIDVLAAVCRAAPISVGVVVEGVLPRAAGPGPTVAGNLPDAPPAWYACALRRDMLATLAPEAELRHDLAVDLLLWRTLLLPGLALAWTDRPAAAAATADVEPPLAVWRDKASYAQAVRHAFVEPLEQAAALQGAAPRWLQLAVLRHLAWYFTVDARERAPTVIVDEPMAVVFHELVGRALRQVDMDLLERLPAHLACPEVCHALWSYRPGARHSIPMADAYDHDQGLMRLTYWIHDAPPSERLVADGEPLQPAFAKLRACNYFRRRLLRQRIAWLPVTAKCALSVELAGRAMPIRVAPQLFTLALPVVADAAPLSLDCVRAAFRPGKAGLQRPLPPGWAGWKVRLIKALARFAPVRRHYRNAWVFVDRDVDAADSAEHLYRWVREHHPEVNAWYLLHPDSPEWQRLRAEGFRLLAPGLRRRLLALNCAHVVSSHVGQEFGLDPARYGDRMQWRYSFLQHGVIKDDISHWLNPSAFDVFITSSPAEHRSVVGDDTPYIYTEREVRCTGLPRHDRLLRIARETPRHEIKLLLIMPTWRASLADERTGARDSAERLEVFARSDYARQWRALLNNAALHRRVREAGLRLAYVPHANAEPFMAALEIPAVVEVVRFSSGKAQQAFARAAAFITDYTSAAFELALLRRPVFYYQFDQKDFYGGGHNWRPGYFDFARDGFGPVALNEAELLAELERFFAGDGQAEAEYLARMQRAMPHQEETACRAAFDAIVEARGHRKPARARAGSASNVVSDVLECR